MSLTWRATSAVGSVTIQAREELQPIEKRLGRLECKTDAIHRDLMTLRVELRGVIDPDFPSLLATQEG